MGDMATLGHGKTARRDHLWVLAVIAACALAEVWASWVGIAFLSGFPKLDGIPTDWILAVVVEAYWAYALYAWLAASPGPRSRSFAMWSCGIVFVLSLIGQVSYHEMTVPAGTSLGRRVVVGFVTVLPVTILALIAILIHLRHTDREEAARLAVESEEASERDALRAALEAAERARADAAADREAAQKEAAALAARNEMLTRKLAAAAPRKRTPQAPAKKPAAAPRSQPAEPPAEDPATDVPNDVDAQAEALAILAAEPDISGAKLAERVGMSERWGQTFKRNLAARSAGPEGAAS
jgi:uncharacterized membrane protein